MGSIRNALEIDRAAVSPATEVTEGSLTLKLTGAPFSMVCA